MNGECGPIPVEASRALHVVRDVLGDTLVAAYLHGSAVSGGLRRHSDVDVLAVVDRATTRAARQRLVSALLRESGRPGSCDGARPIELVVVHRENLVPATYPRRCEVVYGEWLRESFETGAVPEPGTDPELSVLLAQARRQAKTLAGACPGALLPIISEDELRRAIGDTLPGLLETVDGDERNVLLTLARMWRTLATGEIVPKDVAAAWAMQRLPRKAAELIGHAREAYLGGLQDDWRSRRAIVADVVSDLHARIAAML